MPFRHGVADRDFDRGSTVFESSALDALAWELVKLPGGEMSGFRKALRSSDEACQLEPRNGILLTTLGVAYYRASNYVKALDTLLRSDAINKT